MTKEKIGRVVAKARKAKGVTFYQLQRDAQVQRAQILAIEDGSNNYSIETLLQVCDYLEIAINMNPNPWKSVPVK